VTEHLDEVAATVFRALGHPTRVWLVRRLAQGESCVCDLLRELTIDQPLLSQHLQVMRRSGILQARRDGNRMLYSLTRPEYALIVAALDQGMSLPLATAT